MNLMNPLPIPQGPQLDLMQQQMFAKALGGQQGLLLPPGGNPLQPFPGLPGFK